MVRTTGRADEAVVSQVFVPRVDVKGPARRQQLIQATVRLIVQGGVTAVSHRSVSEEAGLPIAATTYYFSSLDALVSAAFRAYFESFIHDPHSRLFTDSGVAVDGVDTVVEGFFTLVSERPDAYRALFELQLVASRRADLRGYSVIYWDQQVQGMQQLLSVSPEAARAAIALFDGYLVSFLSTGYTPDREQFRRLLTTIATEG